jgi:L-seryl-tRNA(Ser) seleniumtransferase
MTDPRSAIPSVDRLVASDDFAPILARYPRARVVEAARRAVAHVRALLERGDGPGDLDDASLYASRAREDLEAGDVPSLRPVINATGVILHTNLGRAPLAEAAVEAMLEAARGYTNL